MLNRLCQYFVVMCAPVILKCYSVQYFVVMMLLEVFCPKKRIDDAELFRHKTSHTGTMISTRIFWVYFTCSAG